MIEKAKFNHVTRPKVEKVLQAVQNLSRKASLEFAQVPLQSQEAYELAAKGPLRPRGEEGVENTEEETVFYSLKVTI